MNNRELKQTQYRQGREQEQLVGYWLKTKSLGVNRKDLMRHPQFDDVMILIKYREQFPDLSKYDKNKFDTAWRWCYINKYALKRKHLNWLEKGAIETMAKRKKQTQAQALIKAKRGQNPSPTEKDHDMTAKGSFRYTTG